jgi:hypothetical protein
MHPINAPGVGFRAFDNGVPTLRGIMKISIRFQNVVFVPIQINIAFSINTVK